MVSSELHVQSLERGSRGLHFDLVFSPGINCLDSDAVSIHIVFAEFVRRVQSELTFSRNSGEFLASTPPSEIVLSFSYLLGRHRLQEPPAVIQFCMTLTAAQSGKEIERFYGRNGGLPVVSSWAWITQHSIQAGVLASELQREQRWAFPPIDLVILLIGNETGVRRGF